MAALVEYICLLAHRLVCSVQALSVMCLRGLLPSLRRLDLIGDSDFLDLLGELALRAGDRLDGVLRGGARSEWRGVHPPEWGGSTSRLAAC